VYGLGLIGLISVQLLRAHGCEVMGVDIHPGRLELAKQFGAKIVQAGEGSNPSASAMAWTEGKGVDGVLITAAAKTDEIMHQSAEMSRKRGRIVLVGVVGLDLRRSDFYKKELSFQVSCSYGPGRYDDAYEQAGQDYPYAFVRWTEQRNFEAILSSLANGALSVNDMISCRFPLADASEAYAVISNDPSALGVLLQYPPTEKVYKEREITVTVLPAPSSGQAVVGVIGAGNYSRMMLMPCLSKTSARLAYIADLNGAAAHNLAQKFNVGKATTDYRTILEDPAVQAIFIATGHSMHARLICESLAAGKHTFTEKPLATNAEQLEKIRQAYQEAKDRLLMVGFNRRFSPHVQKIKNLLAGRGEPLCMSMTINAGFVPSEHPIHDVVKEGGRIIGEGCHFIDLLAFLANSPVAGVSAAMMGKGVAVHEDKMSITLLFEDGSVGTVNYFANGHKSYPKETLEVFSDQRVLRMENFRRLLGYGFPRFKKFKTSRQDKGHAAEFAAFVERVASGGGPPIPFEELYNSTQASFAAMVAARENKTIVL
jgi:predicted dehydrogenase